MADLQSASVLVKAGEAFSLLLTERQATIFVALAKKHFAGYEYLFIDEMPKKTMFSGLSLLIYSTVFHEKIFDLVLAICLKKDSYNAELSKGEDGYILCVYPFGDKYASMKRVSNKRA